MFNLLDDFPDEHLNSWHNYGWTTRYLVFHWSRLACLLPNLVHHLDHPGVRLASV